MERVYSTYYQQIKETDLRFVRYLFDQLDWKSDRLIAITGARGCGKSTLMLQYIKKEWGSAAQNVIYISLDHIWFTTNSLYNFVDEFVKRGGEYLFLDEVHNYENWSQEIKNIYDNFPKLRIVFTGSSMLEIYKGNGDLSRRAVHYTLNGLSFREFLEFEYKQKLPAISLPELLKNHVEIAQNICSEHKIISLFEDYLKLGYFPYYKENPKNYHSKLLNTLNAVLDMDLPAIENIDHFSIRKLKRLLMIMSEMVPFTPNITQLSAQLGSSRNSTLNYLSLLQRAQIINLLEQDASGLRILAKPEKIYLNNTNLCYALTSDKPNIGNLRETFFLNQLKAVATVTSSPKCDFLVDDKYSFEIGGKNKGSEQIMGIENGFLALDNIEIGFDRKIPLWLFGFLY
jgi:predicted AAA+ superfamily ATPase